MFEDARNEYVVRNCPADDPEFLEDLLNEMSEEGWDLYSLNETESDEGEYLYNCIFARKVSGYFDSDKEDFADIGDFNTRMEKLLYSGGDIYKECRSLQRNIKEKTEKINKIKSSLDSNSTDIDREELNKEISGQLDELRELKSKFSKLLSPANMYTKITQDIIRIVISDELSELIDSQKDGDLLAESVRLRQKLTGELGFVIPQIQFTSSDALNENEYEIKIRNFTALKSLAYVGHRRFLTGQANIDVTTENVIEDIDPISGKKTFWLEEEKTKSFWDSGDTPARVISNHLECLVIRYIDEILSYSDILNYMSLLGEDNLFLADELLQAGISVGDLKYIFASLIREKVSLKDIVYIFEKLNDLISHEYSKEQLVEHLRVLIKRQICDSVADTDNTIYAVTISENFYDQFEKALADKEESLFSDSEDFTEFLSYVSGSMENAGAEVDKYVLISKPEFRKPLFYLLEQDYANLAVLSEDEIADEFNIEVL